MTTKSIPKRPWLKRVLKSDQSMFVCEKCNGTGGDPKYNDLNYNLYNAQISWNRKNREIILFCCTKCYGEGYIEWIENATGKQLIDGEELLIDPGWNSVEFLLSALAGPKNKYTIGFHYNSSENDWETAKEDIDINQGITNFYKFKHLVKDFLYERHRRNLNFEIYDALVFNGQTCTKCFSLVPDKILIDRLKENSKIIPAMPYDEIDFEAMIISDPNYPLFRLCDACNKNISLSEIVQLKKMAFTQNNSQEFSEQFIDKLYSIEPPLIFI
jgi:hypothetical protein